MSKQTIAVTKIYSELGSDVKTDYSLLSLTPGGTKTTIFQRIMLHIS